MRPLRTSRVLLTFAAVKGSWWKSAGSIARCSGQSISVGNPPYALTLAPGLRAGTQSTAACTQRSLHLRDTYALLCKGSSHWPPTGASTDGKQSLVKGEGATPGSPNALQTLGSSVASTGWPRCESTRHQAEHHNSLLCLLELHDGLVNGVRQAATLFTPCITWRHLQIGCCLHARRHSNRRYQNK